MTSNPSNNPPVLTHRSGGLYVLNGGAPPTNKPAQTKKRHEIRAHQLRWRKRTTTTASTRFSNRPSGGTSRFYNRTPFNEVGRPTEFKPWVLILGFAFLFASFVVATWSAIVTLVRAGRVLWGALRLFRPT
ncbi:hypothetical protein F4859DRAFT_508780 [Xylaria cf. heliscus]|nr:hypothetical protein F4859DRAFT_508780 [Xylaria cf. heliscus]